MAFRAQHLVQLADHVHRQAHGARLIHDRAFDALADPPGGVSRKAEAARRIEFFDRVHQAEIAFLDQVEQRTPRFK